MYGIDQRPPEGESSVGRDPWQMQHAVRCTGIGTSKRLRRGKCIRLFIQEPYVQVEVVKWRVSCKLRSQRDNEKVRRKGAQDVRAKLWTYSELSWYFRVIRV